MVRWFKVTLLRIQWHYLQRRITETERSLDTILEFLPLMRQGKESWYWEKEAVRLTLLWEELRQETWEVYRKALSPGTQVQKPYVSKETLKDAVRDTAHAPITDNHGVVSNERLQ